VGVFGFGAAGGVGLEGNERVGGVEAYAYYVDYWRGCHLVIVIAVSVEDA
jgi:hypothetical protein